MAVSKVLTTDYRRSKLLHDNKGSFQGNQDKNYNHINSNHNTITGKSRSFAFPKTKTKEFTIKNNSINNNSIGFKKYMARQWNRGT